MSRSRFCALYWFCFSFYHIGLNNFRHTIGGMGAYDWLDRSDGLCSLSATSEVSVHESTETGVYEVTVGWKEGGGKEPAVACGRTAPQEYETAHDRIHPTTP